MSREFCTSNTHPGRAPHTVSMLRLASMVHDGTPGSPTSAPERPSAKTCTPAPLTSDGAESVHNEVHNPGARFEPRWHGRHRSDSEKLVEAGRCQGTALPPLVVLQERPARPPHLAPSNNASEQGSVRIGIYLDLVPYCTQYMCTHHVLYSMEGEGRYM